jgi:hypothetical protein
MPAETVASDANEGDALPDWLRSLAQDETDVTAPPAAPDTLRESPQLFNLPEDDTPDWLRESTPPTPAPPADTTPGWLRETASPAPADPTPDWLRESTSPAPADTMPDWLRESTPPTPAPPADTTPGWLRETASPAPADPTPDWLRESTPPAPPPADPTPDWLAEPSVNEQPDLGDDFRVTPFSLDMIGEEADVPPAAASGAPSWLTSQDDERDGAPAWLSTLDSQPSTGHETHAGLSWLNQPEPPAVPSAQATKDTPADDIPPWLQEITPATASSAPSPTPSPAADIPPWLQDVQPAQSAASDLPDWLRSSEPAQADIAAAPLEPIRASDQALPDWLRAEAAEPNIAPSEQVQQSPEASTLPEWLRDAAPAAPESSASAPSVSLPEWLRESPSMAAPPGVPVEIPEWLRAAAEESSTAQKAPSEPVPDWLAQPTPAPEPPVTSGTDLPPWLRDERGQPLPTAVPPGEAGLPEWLRGAPAVARSPDPPHVPTAVAASEPTRPGVEWFDNEPPPVVPDSGLLGGTELPAWLRAETEVKPETSVVDTRSTDWLLNRIGVQDDEAVSAVAAPTPRLAPPRAPARSAAQIEAAALLRQLTAQPLPNVEPAAAKPSPGILRRIGLERALSLVLLLALMIALAMPSLSAGLRAAPTAPGATALLQQIDQFDENDVVLVGYEWDARRAGELRPLEQAVIGHLIARQVKLVLVSTDPQGTLLLFDLRDQLTDAGYAQNGEGYLLLGYKPGGELALRSMAQDFGATLRSDFAGNDATISVLANGLETGQPLDDLRDFSMVLVLADDAPDVQAWMEQIRPPTDATVDALGIPMAFLLPAEATPIIQPYLVQPNVLHLAGQAGALTYQSQRAVADEQIAVQIGQQRLSVLIFVGLLVAGAVIATVGALAQRRRGVA